MKLLLSIVLLLVCTIVNAQTSPADSLKQVQIMREAAGYLRGAGKPYYPEKAFELYLQCAMAGNAKGMNAVAILYAQGLGVPANISTAILWYEKAALNGYVTAWSNLGLMYKNGSGTVEPDYAKAYECFRKGAEYKDITSIFQQAYMLYKGLGCKQNYEQAFELFHQSSLNGNVASMYFLGLCYRNGYGTAWNADKANYWLTLSASRGYEQSKEELKLKNPENPDVVEEGNTSNTAKQQKIEGEPKHYVKSKHNINKHELSGNYKGYAIRYDWSGQHIISRSAISLQLTSNDSVISGLWVEDDSLHAKLQATLTDSALVFNNSRYSRTHHYSSEQPEEFEFKNTTLEMVKSNGTINLAGNIQLYSPRRKEPGKPLYVILIKDDEKVTEMAASTEPGNGKKGLEPIILKPEKQPAPSNKLKLLAYPNPFSNSLNVEFSLKSSSDVSISIISMNGRTILSKELKQVVEGLHKQSLPVSVPAGAYMVIVSYGKEKESILVLKK